MDLRTAEALYVVGVLPPESLGDVGVSLLGDGHDSPAVREMAGLDGRATWQDAGDVFERALAELGRSLPTAAEGAYRIAEQAARDILAGRVSPYEGAARIAYGPYQAADYPDDLTPFYYWADEWEDLPEFRDACAADIRDRARGFLAARGAPAA